MMSMEADVVPVTDKGKEHGNEHHRDARTQA